MGRKRIFDGEWPPAEKPANFEFSLHKKGWAKWYRGQSRVIPLRTLDRGAVRRAWDAKRVEIDADLAARAEGIRRVTAGQTTLREAAVHFMDWLDYRVANPDREPLADVTAEDYKRVLESFCRVVGPDRPLGSLTQVDFGTFADTLSANAPSTLYRVVSYVQAWLTYCVDEGLLAAAPNYGRRFVKPSAQVRRDARLSIEKSYDHRQVREMYAVARPEERLWIMLGLCGAMDNSDLGNLTWDLLDRKEGIIDYRRRKVGKVRRVIPMPREFWSALGDHTTPTPRDPAHADRVFLTPEGYLLQRKVISAEREKPYFQDYVRMRWTRLMIKAGLKEPMPNRERKQFRTLPRRNKEPGKPDGAGFRALRTTFPNFAPAGYRDEVEIVMGHSHGEVLLENYLEKVGYVRLRELINSVYHQGLASSSALPWVKPAEARTTAKPSTD